MKEFPNVSFVAMHPNINMDSNKRVQCKQINNEKKEEKMYEHLKRGLLTI